MLFNIILLPIRIRIWTAIKIEIPIHTNACFAKFLSEMVPVILFGLPNEICAILQHEKGSGASYQQVPADELSIEEHFAAIIDLDMHLFCTRINTYFCSNIS
jgi:hypothetical protein